MMSPQDDPLARLESLMPLCWVHCCLLSVSVIKIRLLRKISKFVDDTKLGANVRFLEGVWQLQTEPMNSNEWLEKGKIPFILGKCNVIHIDHHVTPSGCAVETSDLEKDFGVLKSSNFMFSKKSLEAEKKNKLLGYISLPF